jgi:hypothetical protein
MKRWLAAAVLAIAAVSLPRLHHDRGATNAPLVLAAQSVGNGLTMHTVAFGHESRQDDWPSIAAAPDGSLWTAWLSFDGARDDIALRHYRDNKWSNLMWVPATSGDSWMPQVGVDAHNRVWVVWSQQLEGNWDLYARRFDPERQEWSKARRLTSHPAADIHPRMVSNGASRFAVVWQSFREKNSNIFLITFDGENWSNEIRVTRHAANDWFPSVALDKQGTAWIAYDSYRNGNYDVYLSRVRDGVVSGQEMPIASTQRYDAMATVAVDSADRVWVAWESGPANWGKDVGYVIREHQGGEPLGGLREARIRCFAGGQWREPEGSLTEAFAGEVTHQPSVLSDGRGSVWVVGKVRTAGASKGAVPRTYWEYRATHLDGGRWSKAFVLPESRGRSSTRMGGVLSGSGDLWVAWPTDERKESNVHRPIRQRVYAGTLPASVQSADPVWRAAPSAEPAPVNPVHPDESASVEDCRAYSAIVGGKRMRLLRGDFHRHTELSWDGGGERDGSLPEFYRYMIDVAALDFGASTDHQGGAFPYWWWYTQKMTDMFHVPGAFVAIYGYERSPQWPKGNRNIFWAKRSDVRITPLFMRDGTPGFSLPPGPTGDESGVGMNNPMDGDTQLLYEELRPTKAVIIPHTSGTFMGNDWKDNDPQLEPVVEIFQGSRTSYEMVGAPLVADPIKDAEHIKVTQYKPEGMVSEGLAKGYRLGVIASSDHGSTHISYAMVYTDDPTRQGILDAFRSRHVYGAMDNIILDVHMGAHFMGDEFALAKAEPIRVQARGTRAVKRVTILKDSREIYSVQPGGREVHFEFTDRNSLSGRHYYYVRLVQEDDMVAWSSPFFVTYR